jgi:hypothetical protein
MPILRAVRMTRRAISPRLAISIFFILILLAGLCNGQKYNIYV